MGQKTWRCGAWRVELEPPCVVGVLNMTPDSFSDGGLFMDEDTALAHALAMVGGGARVVDIGGESTRPGAPGVSVAEERARVVGVVERLSAKSVVPVSIDTRHSVVAEECLRAGASIVNDVGGFRSSEMIELMAADEAGGAGAVVMHMRGEPRSMQDDPHYDDVVAEVRAFLGDRAAALESAGVRPERIVVDPGIGFGKTHGHNIELLRRLGELCRLGYPVMVGASRKRFLGNILGVDEPRERVWGSVGAAAYAVMRGADIVRVHDVPETAQALKVIGAIGR